MNTFAGTATRPVIVAGLPEMASALSAAGLEVVSGPDFPSVAQAGMQVIAQKGPCYLVVRDENQAGLQPWTERVVGHLGCRAVIVRQPGAQSHLNIPGVPVIPHTSSASDILAALGIKSPAPAAPSWEAAPAAPAPSAPSWDAAPTTATSSWESAPAAKAPEAPSWEATPPAKSPQAPSAPSWESAPAAKAPEAPSWESAPPAKSPEAQSAQSWESAPPAKAPEAQSAPSWESAPAAKAPQAPSAPSWEAAPAAKAPQAPSAPSWEAAPAAKAPEAPSWESAPSKTESSWENAPAPKAASAPQQTIAPSWENKPAEPSWNTEPAPSAVSAPSWNAPAQAPSWDAPAQTAPSWNTEPTPTGQQPAAASWEQPAPQATQAWDAKPEPREPEQESVAPPAISANASAAVDAAAYETPAYVRPTSAKTLGTLIFAVGGKGGIGKSTTAIQLAHECSKAGMKTVLVDGNVGQPDLATYLRLAKSKSGQNGLPTIYDATLSGEMAAILTSDAINAARDSGADTVNFGFVAGAPADLNDPSVVNEDLYGRVIAFAQTLADVVVIDTQIIESADRSGFVDRLIIPALLSGAHALALTDMSSAGVQNINYVFRQFLNEEVDMSRVRVAINRVETSSMHVASTSDKYFAQMNVGLIGAVPADMSIAELTNAGQLELDNPPLTNMIRTYLGSVFGAGRFPLEENTRQAEPTKSKRKLWGRK